MTPSTPAEMRGALARAHVKLTGRAASPGLLDALTAQVNLETGRGKSMANFNFGGIKGTSPSGQTAHYMTREVIDNKDVHLEQGFRAYNSIDEGAIDYLSLMKNRFGDALVPATRGDMDGFAHALKKAGYYTAPETEYASALRSLANDPTANGHTGSVGHAAMQAIPAPVASMKEMLPKIGSAEPIASFSTGEEISRLVNALSTSAWRIAAPTSDE